MKTNEQLQKDVMHVIHLDPLLKEVAYEIAVTADGGVVTLSGMVDTYAKKLAAETDAQRVRGVKVVAVDLEVKVDGYLKKSDSELAGIIKNALTWHSAVNEARIEIKVDDGWVFLEGQVEWDFEKKAVENSIQQLVGVRGITNRITVERTTLDPVMIKNQISAAFHRSAIIDSASIEVETTGSRVILRGKVRSWREKKDAENVAWTSRGVLAVDNQIEVETEVLA